MKYTLELMESLNKEYSEKPLATEFREYSVEGQLQNAEKKLENLNKKIALQGLKVLEIGCGEGHTSYMLAAKYNCDVLGIDIVSSNGWESLQHKNLRFMECDICENALANEKFDLIISYVAWEHIKKPFEALLQAKRLLKDNGKFYLYALLYRGAKASHLYRHIFFPWPHLLFDAELVKGYALQLGAEQWWVDSFYDLNKLTYAEYKEYFKILGFKIVDEYLKFRPLDVDFYKRFEDKLGLYPVYDLTLDYFAVILENSDGICEMKPYGVGEITIDSEKRTVGDEMVVNTSTIDKNLEYAWDVICNGQKVKYVKWGSESKLVYIPEQEGTYTFKCYIRRCGSSARTVRFSQEMEVNEVGL